MLHFFAQSQGIVYMHQTPSVVDYCTKYGQNQPFLFWDIGTNRYNLWKMAIITQIWHGAKCYFICIIVPNMNKINQFFSWDITTNTQNVWKSGHNYANWAQNQILVYKHKQYIGTWYMVPNNKITTFLRYHNKHSKCMKKLS